MKTAPARILVLGGDGYVGWPLALKLALSHPQARVLLADNLSRRRLVAEVGGDSVTPIAAPAERIRAFRDTFEQDNLSFVGVDAASPALDALVEAEQPTHIFHLAQQASAPYSMMDPERAVYTATNNEVGNLRVLWAIRRHVPTAHLIKLGSFGEYARPGFDVAEGYFRPTYKGVEASVDTPFPRAADDIYHVTKINDTNFISMACRKWGLRVTDVMQSTLFGVFTAETRLHPALYTRFDYDAVFGTVLNRFLTQAVMGCPLTVYGTGWQRTGLMALEDATGSLAALVDHPPAVGEHRVINHVTERDFCINELAERVQAVASSRGATIPIERTFDPRNEQDLCKATYTVEAGHVDEHVRPTPLDQVLGPVFDIVALNAARIDPRRFAPTVRWCG
jgi:UDP-sulfoquinovose synthase